MFKLTADQAAGLEYIFCYGTKAVKARPMTRQEYNDHRGWVVPGDEDPNDLGYLVEYTDGGKPNHPDHEGYISWSPKAQFEQAYDPTNKLRFGHALAALEHGHRVCRQGWSGKDSWLTLIGGSHEPSANDVDYIVRDDSDDSYLDGLALLPFIAIKTATGELVPWLASQTDMLSRDWMLVE